MTDSMLWALLLVIAFGTFAIRGAFLMFAHRFVAIPPSVSEALRMIPAAVFAALVVPAVLRTDGQLDLWSPQILAGVLAAAVAYLTRSVLATIAVGMVALMAVERLV